MSRQDDVEDYSPERVAEFLLNNAVTAEDWDAAAAEVRRLGLDPDQIANVDPGARAKLITNVEFDAKFDRLARVSDVERLRTA